MSTDSTSVDDNSPDLVLHVVASAYNGYHLVSPDTLEEATAAQAAADAAPYYENFGELRRSGDSALLADYLVDYLTLEAYAEAIERSAQRAAASSDIDHRLAALHDVDFDGDDDANAPADADQFRSEHELEQEVEDHYALTLATGMCDDVPEDILSAFEAYENLMFVDYMSASVEDGKLVEMISALEARGFTVIRDDV